MNKSEYHSFQKLIYDGRSSTYDSLLVNNYVQLPIINQIGIILPFLYSRNIQFALTHKKEKTNFFII